MSSDTSAAITELVVGLDGSPESVQALAWASDEARRRGCSVRAVRAWYPTGDPREAEEISKLSSTAQLRAAILADFTSTVNAALGTAAEDVAVTPEVWFGEPAKALIDAAGADRLLVVGSRGRGALTGALVGSVSQTCAQYARCPTVIVRGQSGRVSSHRIVVGVDGSVGSVNALHFAALSAHVRGAAVHVVHAWLGTISSQSESTWPEPDRTHEMTAATVLQESLRRGLAGVPRVEVTTELVETAAHLALLKAAEDADLLVVGSRGRGGWKGLLMGSVSLHCITQSPCPVAIMRGG